MRIIAMVLLLVSFGCFAGTAGTREWAVYSLGVSSFHDAYWCDNSHLALGNTFIKSEPQPPVYIDAERPDHPRPLSISGKDGVVLPILISGCENGTVIAAGAHTVDGKMVPHTSALYLIRPDGTSRIVAVGRNGMVTRSSKLISIEGKKITQPVLRIAKSTGFSVAENCASYVDKEYDLLCIGRVSGRVVTLREFVVADYIWQTPTVARDEEGRFVDVPNTSAKLMKDGAPVTSGFVLYDRKGQFVKWLDKDENYQVGMHHSEPDAEEELLYAPCKRAGKSKFTDDFDSVCKIGLDAKSKNWEVVFSFPNADHLRSGIKYLSIDSAGNIYFTLAHVSGEKGGGVWRFRKSDSRVLQIIGGLDRTFDSMPKITLDGERLIFARNKVWHVAKAPNK